MYYESWMACSDPKCGSRTQQCPVADNGCLRRGCEGSLHPEYSEEVSEYSEGARGNNDRSIALEVRAKASVETYGRQHFLTQWVE